MTPVPRTNPSRLISYPHGVEKIGLRQFLGWNSSDFIILWSIPSHHPIQELYAKASVINPFQLHSTSSAVLNVPRHLRSYKPKLDLPPEAIPNHAVSLNFMPLKIPNMEADILAIIDHGDILLRLNLLPDGSGINSLQAFYNCWIAIFDAPT